MTQYEIRFKNSLEKALYFGVYQKYPMAPGLKSVAWKVVGIPPGGSGSTTWTMDYGVAIANWQTGPPGHYSEEQIVPAQLSHRYEIAGSSGAPDIPQISSKPVESFPKGSEDLIKLSNSTPRKMTAGFALNGNLLAVEDVDGGETSNFVVHPTYFVATFHNIKKGMMVDAGVQLTPVEVEFTQGFTVIQVEATITDGGRQTLQASRIS